MLLHDRLNKLFGKSEEINGNNRCPTYLFRWTILKLKKGRSIYLHHFVGNDWSKDFHDHPKRFISIGLKGSYWEDTPLGSRFYYAPWIRSFPAKHIHRLRVPYGNTWTLVIVLKTEREWGFWHKELFINFKDYVKGRYSSLADSNKDCI